MNNNDGFDWVPEQQRQIQRQVIKNSIVSSLFWLMVIGGVIVATGVIGD